MREVKVSRINVTDQTIEQRTDYIAEDTPIHISLTNITTEQSCVPLNKWKKWFLDIFSLKDY